MICKECDTHLSYNSEIYFHVCIHLFISSLLSSMWGTAVAQGTVLHNGRSLVRSQLVSLGFFIDIKSFRSHYGPGVESYFNRNDYRVHFLGAKAAGA